MVREIVYKLKGERGMSLVEALVAVLLTFILAVFVAGMITSFGHFTRTDKSLLCLIQALESGLQAKKSDPTITSYTVRCGSWTINVNLSGGPPASPPPYCAQITASASLEGRTMNMVDLACAF